MSERISIRRLKALPDLRVYSGTSANPKAATETPQWIPVDTILALVEAAEAAHRVYEGWLAGDFDWDELAAALSRFDFGEDA